LNNEWKLIYEKEKKRERRGRGKTQTTEWPPIEGEEMEQVRTHNRMASDNNRYQCNFPI
jgi:hypothetical protein